MQVDRPTFLNFIGVVVLIVKIHHLHFLLSMSLHNYTQEIVSLVLESVNNGASVEDRQQKGFVQVLSGSVIRYVEADLF